MRPLAAVAVAAMLLLSGCATQAFTGTSEPVPSNATTTPSTTTATPATTADDSSAATDAASNEEKHPVNDSATFQNLTALVDVRETRKPTATEISVPSESGTPPPFLVLLGLDESEGLAAGETYGYATAIDQIYVAYDDAPDRAIERLLVHEQFHTIQFQQDWIDYQLGQTRDARLADQGVVEGTAVWVTGEYVDRYEGSDAPSGYERYQSHVEDGPDGNRLLSAPYLFGARWTEHHLDDPANVSWAFDNSPETTEQLMHNMTADEEPALPVDLDVRSDESLDGDGDRMGELYVWATLRGELSENRSRTAAAGWGGDELRRVGETTGEVENLAWALRWDTERDADEFAAAADAWATARDWNGSTRVVRANATTTVLLVGDEAFVVDANVSVEGTTVVVTGDGAGDANESRSTVVQVTSQESPPRS
jgi:hypothetical protein